MGPPTPFLPGPALARLIAFTLLMKKLSSFRVAQDRVRCQTLTPFVQGTRGCRDRDQRDLLSVSLQPRDRLARQVHRALSPDLIVLVEVR